MRHPFTKRGISVIEIIISASIIALTVTAIVSVVQIYLSIVKQNTIETQAVLLLDETSEAIQYLRDASFESNFASLEKNSPYTIFWNGTGYELTDEVIILPYDMTRKIYFTEVERNSDGIISSSGTVDPETLKANIVIEWPFEGEEKEISAEMLIHNNYEN